MFADVNSRPLSPIRVGLIGCGNISLSNHVPTFLDHPETFTLVALADPTAERLARGRAQAGLPEDAAYEDPTELLRRDDLDMIDLCTPQHVRRDLAIAAAESGRHVLSEKPIATTPADARRIVAAARAAQVRYGIVHNYLFFPEVQRALEIIGQGEIGDVEVARLDWLSCRDFPGNAAYRPTWRHDLGSAGGGVLMDMLHIVYLAEALLGRPIERVSGWLHGRGDGAPVEDIALARFEVDGGAALVNVGWGEGPGGIAVSGSEGRVEVTYRDGLSGAFEPFEQLKVQGRAGRRIETDIPQSNGMSEAILDFGASVIAGRDSVAPGEQGLHILEATLAVYLSAATGETVGLPIPEDHPVSLEGALGLARLDLPEWSPLRRHHLFRLR